MSPDFDVVIVGAGVAGLYQIYKIKNMGLRVKCLETAPKIGGTWYWNRYPGARFDSESWTYGYSFSRELLDEWNWTEDFAPQPETEKYLNYVADKFNLDKNKIKENYSEFISDKANLDEITYMTTGGSTGSPLKILMNKETRSKSHAATRYYLKKAGITPGLERGVRLHGNKIPKEYIDLEKFWIQEGNRLTMSVSHITMDNCSLYMEAIKDFKPNYIHAYASALALLCKYAEKNNEKFPSSIENIFCDSETVYGWQRDLIIKLTGAQFYNIYGHTEAAGMAITFPESAQLESLPVGIMEILDSNLNNLSKEKDEGQIVVTGFHNKIMPFIRYKTSDIAELGSSKKIEERFFTPILSNVKGRIQDYLVGFDESIVPAAPLLFDYNFDWTGIDLFQVYQFKKGKLEFKIVKNKSIDSNEAILEQRLIDSFSGIFGEQFSVEVSFHDELLVTKRGKYRYVDQKLEIEI